MRLAGNKPFIYSSDFPHEVNHATAKEEIEEVRENPRLTDDDKAAILHANAPAFLPARLVSRVTNTVMNLRVLLAVG